MATQPLSIDQFAAKIKTKYPDYASMENGDLVNKIVAKYPEYKSQIDFSTSSAPNAGLAGVAQPKVNMQPIGDEDLTPMMGNGMPTQQDLNPTEAQHPAMTAGLKRVGQVVKGIGHTFGDAPQGTAEKVATAVAGPGGLPFLRIIRGQAQASKQAFQQAAGYGSKVDYLKDEKGNPVIGEGGELVPASEEDALQDARSKVTALSALNPFASGSVANINQLQDENKPDQALGEGAADALLLGAGMPGPAKAIGGVVKDSLASAGKGVSAAGDVLNNARSTLAEKAVAPLVRKPLNATLQDARYSRNPAQAIVDEGLVGTKNQILNQSQARIGELSDATDATLQNHPNSGVIIDAKPVIDSAIDNAVTAAEKTGNQAGVTRLENLRDALHTKYGPTQGTPFQINNLKREVGQVASDLGAFKSTDPIEASAASAMQDVYSGLKNAVNKQVPEVTPLNERVSNLLSAQTGLKRNMALEGNHSLLDSHTLFSAGAKALKKTIASAPVRSATARVLNAGNTLDVPQVQPQSAPLFIRKQLQAAPTITPPPADTSGTVPFNAPPVADTSRAQRMGLLLPEKTGEPIPLQASTAPTGEEGLLAPGKVITRDPKTGQAKTFFTSGSEAQSGPPQYQMGAAKRPSFLERRQSANSDLRTVLDNAKQGMTPEQTTDAMFTDEKSGMPNRKAFNIAQQSFSQSHPHVGFADIDDFKNYNSVLGEPAVDQKVFPAIGDAMKAAIAKEGGKVHGFHVHGDEFNFLASDPAAIGRVVDSVNSSLKNAEFTVQKPDGGVSSIKGVGFSYGTGADEASAAVSEKANKQFRKETGLRTGTRDAAQNSVAGSPQGSPAGEPTAINQNERQSVRGTSNPNADQQNPVMPPATPVPPFLRKKKK